MAPCGSARSLRSVGSSVGSFRFRSSDILVLVHVHRLFLFLVGIHLVGSGTNLCR